MPLKLILMSPDNTVFGKDRKAKPKVITDLITFIQRMSDKGVQVALWSRHEWTNGDKPLNVWLENRSGVPVRYFVAATGDLKARQYKGSVDPILTELGVKKHETILVGAGDTDFKAGVNNQLLLVRPAWFGSETQYGFRVSSIGRLARFCEVFALREHPIFWLIDDAPLRVVSMGPFSTYLTAFAEFGAAAKLVAKDNAGDSKFWFLMIVSSLYFSGLVHQTDYICPFPGHDPAVFGATRKLLDDTMARFGKCFRVPYLPDLIIRHVKSQKSQTLNPSEKTFINHLSTIHLNQHPHKNGSTKTNKKPISLKGKTVLVVDDFLTNGRSLDTARAYINAAGGEAILFSWLKTINSDYLRMRPNPTLKPFQANSFMFDPTHDSYGYHLHVVDSAAPIEIKQVLDAYRNWTWPPTP